MSACARGAVDLEHLDLDLVADLDEVVGLADPRPAHLADGQKAVDTRKVDEGAKALDRPDHAVVDLTFLERRPGALAQLGPFLLEPVMARVERVAARGRWLR